MIARTTVLAVILVLLGSSAYAADCNNGGRYEDMGDGTVQDCRTGLIWLKDAACTDTSGGIANPTGLLSWYDALKWVAGLGTGLCALTDGSSAGDWRLPTKTEWMAMIASAKKQGFTFPALTNAAGTAQWTSGDIFNNVQSYYYWSSTTSPVDSTFAWEVNSSIGIMDTFEKGTPDDFVWPVRGGQSREFGSVTIQ